MNKLDEIPKKQIFDVPDGYFEKLPSIIQSRVIKPVPASGIFSIYSLSLRFVLPVALLMAGIFWFTQPNTETGAEDLLAAIETEDLVAYLRDADITTDDLLDYVTLDANDVIAIEGNVYEYPLNDSGVEEIFNEIAP